MAVDPVVNFAKVRVSTGYDATAVTLALSAGDGAKLPLPASDGAFNLTWWNATDYSDPADDPNVEIVRCTARATDTLTVTRAQEGTSATAKNTSGKAYKLALGPTAKTITDLVSFVGYPLNPQAPTGSINSSNVTFVATGRVSVAFVDSSIDTGAGFVYNSGTNQTTITSSVPPQNSIYAF